jgi:hypothetical protein
LTRGVKLDSDSISHLPIAMPVRMVGVKSFCFEHGIGERQYIRRRGCSEPLLITWMLRRSSEVVDTRALSGMLWKVL